MGGEHPEWLPVDWKVCVRVRSSGKKDKYYINPLNGLKFNSKVEVLRYLKNAEKDMKLKELNKVNIKKTVAEKLPSGWIKEIKIRRKGGKTRRDPHYIDPVSGRHFRSMQEVFRYLETKDSGKAKSEGDEQDHTSEELRDHSKSSTAGAEEQRLVDKKADQIFTDNESIKSDIPETKHVEHREREDDSVNRDLPDKLPQRNEKKAHEDGPSQDTRLASSKPKTNVTVNQCLQSGSEGAAVKNINMPETNALEQREKETRSVAEDGQHENVTPQNKRKKLNSKWMNGLPRRTSKRLARVEADPSLEIKTSCQAREAARLSVEAEVNTTESIDKARLSGEPEINTTGSFGKSHEPIEHSTTCRTENATENKQKDLAYLPLGDLSSLEQHGGVCVNLKEDEKHEKHLNSSLNDLLMDPCIEFAIKTLTGAIPIEDVNKVDESLVSSLASHNQTSGSSSMLLPSGDIWADPCFEFAVKTLTSEIPVEDGSHFQISFQQPLTSSGASGCNNLTSQKIRSENLHHSSYSFNQYDAVMKPYAQQQGVRDPSLPHGMNGRVTELCQHQPSLWH